MRQILITVTVAVACLALGYAARDLGMVRGQTGTAATSAELHAPSDSVHALGRIEPKGGVYPVGAPAGNRLARFKPGIDVDTQVQQNDELAFLEGYDEREVEIEEIDSQIKEAEDSLALEAKNQEIRRRKLKIEQEQADTFAKLDIDAQETKIDLLKKNLAQSRSELARLQPLQSQTVSPHLMEQQKLVVRRDEAELASAEALLKKSVAGHKIERQEAELQENEIELAPEKARLAAHVAPLKVKRELAKANRDLSVLRAPHAGQILKILVHAGETIGPKPVLQLGDTDHMYAVAEVYEADRGRVRKGQKAEVRSKAFGRDDAHPLVGTVESIEPIIGKNDVLGLDPAADAYARVVQVHIALDEESSKVARDYTNLQVDVKIVTAPNSKAD
jgi:HlyD family secretion protein